MDLETGESLSSSLTSRSSAPSQGSEASPVVSFPRGEGLLLRLSSSEKVNVEGVDESPQSTQYEKLVEVITHAVVKLNLEWPSEKQAEPAKSKLDESFLRSKLLPPHRVCYFSPISTPCGRDHTRPAS